MKKNPWDYFRKKKKLLLAIGFLIVLTAIGIYILMLGKQSNNLLSTPLTTQPKPILPSSTNQEYQDNSGFSFSYPDNLSIAKNETADNKTYADLQLTSNNVSGNFALRITDSPFTAVEEWLESNKEAVVGNPKEKKLGNLTAYEIKTADRLLLGAVDQGVLFTVETPLVEEDFWIKVYDRILTSFTFVLPTNTVSSASTAFPSDDVIFEGEEVVE